MEFLISRYAQGDVAPREREVVEKIVGTDPRAAELLREYESLSLLMRQELKMPALRWDWVAERIVDHVSVETAHVHVAGQIGTGWGWRVAIAAGFVLAVGAVWMLGHRPETKIPNDVAAVAAIVTGPMAEAASGPAVEQIAIGPASTVSTGAAWGYAENVSTQSGRVVIASDENPPAAPVMH